MGIDHLERRRQRKVDAPVRKKSTTPPIAAIEKRVIDSPAYADLTFSARAVLLLLARNLDKDKNGHIKLSERQAASNGIERKTLRRALTHLTTHNLIVMTRRGGRHEGECNRYALTWLSVKDKHGIHTEHFKLDAWQEWRPYHCNKAAPPQMSPR